MGDFLPAIKTLQTWFALIVAGRFFGEIIAAFSKIPWPFERVPEPRRNSIIKARGKWVRRNKEPFYRA